MEAAPRLIFWAGRTNESTWEKWGAPLEPFPCPDGSRRFLRARVLESDAAAPALPLTFSQYPRPRPDARTKGPSEVTYAKIRPRQRGKSHSNPLNRHPLGPSPIAAWGARQAVDGRLAAASSSGLKSLLETGQGIEPWSHQRLGLAQRFPAPEFSSFERSDQPVCA